MFISHRKCKEPTFPLLLNHLMQQSASVFNEVYHVRGEGNAGGMGVKPHVRAHIYSNKVTSNLIAGHTHFFFFRYK